MGIPRASRTRLWAFALGAAACMLVLCLAHHVPDVLGQIPFTSVPGSQTALPTAGTPPEAPPGSTASPEPDLELPEDAQPAVSEPSIRLTIVYDNRLADPRLRSACGFACWIELGDTVVLFDTGGDGAILLGNLAALGYNPDEIDIVVLSHAHDDHTGGLQALLDANDHLVVYLPAGFPESLKARGRGRATLVEVEGPLEITSGVRSLGPMGASPVEQSLALQGTQGVIVITGCAHPGIAAIVAAARERGRIHLVLGGFHLVDRSAATIESVIEQLQGLEVGQIAPCHCTGDEAIRMFAAAFGSGFLEVGAGTALEVPR